VSAPDRQAGDRVDRRQRRDGVAAQDPSHGGSGQPELAGQEDRPAPVLAAQVQDLCFDLGRGSGRAGVRA
jgi:hypothetical protein